ncbi:MAG: dihydroorotate dehydrogenase electron transfer subunit [Clostridia bacterium]|nr:dihydroorotate dehydrogenase electron transfer subunit [Clostridia bacterium]
MNENARVVSMENLCKNSFLMRIEEKRIASLARPGQFVNVLCSRDNKLLLRRPISIMDADASGGTFDIAFEVRGEGTRLLSGFRPGDMLDVMGPLGNGFEFNESYRRIAVVGGGIGIYPLNFLVKRSGDIEIDVFMGYRCSDAVMPCRGIEEGGCNVYLSTDDGSAGHRGFITEVFEKNNAPGKYDMVYICGPVQMAERAAGLVRRAGGRCQVSMEERMGCGIGACLVCSCEVKTKDGTLRKTVCKDGPVFDGFEVFPEVE